MSKFFVILIIAGPAFVESILKLPPAEVESFTSPPLASGSIIEEVIRCLEKQNFSKSIKEEISAEMNNCNSTGSCKNSEMIETIAKLICITDKNQTLLDLIDCVAIQIDFTISKLGNCIGPFYYQCGLKFFKNTINTTFKCDGFANDFYSLVEFIFSILQGEEYEIENLLIQILFVPSILSFDCVEYLRLLKPCLPVIPLLGLL